MLQVRDITSLGPQYLYDPAKSAGLRAIDPRFVVIWIGYRRSAGTPIMGMRAGLHIRLRLTFIAHTVIRQ